MKRQLVHTDDAYRGISTWLTNKGYEYNETKLDTDSAEFEVKLNSYRIIIMFNAQTQLYTFTMLNGKVQSSKTLKSLMERFDMYYHINIVIVPTAKKVADAYEKELGIRTVFENFVGNIVSGYTVKFKEVGSESRGIRVTEESEVVYHACYVEYDDEGGYSVFEEADFDVSGRECKRIKEVFSLEKLADGDNAIFDIENGVLNYDDGDVSLVLRQDEDDLILTEGNYGIMKTKGVKVKARTLVGVVKEVIGQKIWEPISIYDHIKSYLNEEDKLVIDGTEYPLRSIGDMLVIRDGKRDVDIKSLDDFELFYQSHQPTESVTTVVETSDFDGESEVEEPVAESDEPEASQGVGQEEPVEAEKDDAEPVTEEDEGTNSASVVKLLYKGEELVAVRFVNQEGIYDVEPDIVRKAGLDIERIQGVSKLFIKNGLVISDDERKLKKFSHKVSDEKEVHKLLESLFI